MTQEKAPINWDPSHQSVAEQMRGINAAAPMQPLTFHRLWQILRKRKTGIVGMMLLCMGVAGVWSLLPPDYQSQGTIQVRPQSSDTYRVAQAAAQALGGDSDELIESTSYTLTAQTLLLRVATDLKLQNRSEFLPKSLIGRPLTDLETRDVLYRNLNKAIKVEHIPKTEMISITCKTDDPALSAEIINTLVNDYITWLYETRFRSSQRAADWLNGQLTSIYHQIESDQRKIIALQKQLGFVGDGSTTNLNTVTLQGLLAATRDAEVNRLITEARYMNLSSGPPSATEGGFDLITSQSAPRNPTNVLSTLRTQSAAADAEYARELSQFGSNYPAVKQVKAQADSLHQQVADEQNRIVAQAKESLDAARTLETNTNTVLNQEEARLLSKGDQLLDYEILQYNQQMHEQLYQGLVQHLRESTITAGLDAAEVDIVDIAITPYLRWPFTWQVAMAAGAGAGLLLGFILAFVWNSMDQRFSSVEEVEAAVGGAVWTVCPVIRHKSIRKQAKVKEPDGAAPPQLEFIHHPNSQFSEAIRVLRTSVQLLGPSQTIRTIMVTSSAPGEGKSTVSSNLATCLAGGGDHTILVECDLRRPTFSLRLFTSDKVGLSSVLTGMSTLDSAITRVETLNGLDIIGSGPIPPLPAELLGSETMRTLIAKLQNEYRWVIIDVPPALMLTDALILVPYCDAVVVVARLGIVNRGILVRTLNAIKRVAKVPYGIVVNGVDQNTAGYYGYYKDYGYSGYVTED